MKKKVRSKAKPKTAKKTKSRRPVKAKAKAKKSAPKKSSAKISKKSKKAKKTAATPPRSGVIAPANSVLLGIVEDYFAKIGVIALMLKAPVALGQKIQVLGHTTHIEQTVDSMQIDHAPVSQAGSNDSVGIKVMNRARAGDHVYLLK